MNEYRLPDRFLSNILFAAALGIIGFLSLYYYQHLTTKWLEYQQVLVALPSTHLPSLTLPPITPTSLPIKILQPPTPTLTATPTPQPQIPIRLSIPSINVNQPIVEEPLQTTLWNGQQVLKWDVPDFAVGHQESSARPGEQGNMLLAGHNNTGGSVFLRLSEVERGDEVIVYTADETFRYRVEAMETIPWVGANEDQLARHFELGADTHGERVTLISCWPYATYTHRVYVIAEPINE